MSSKVQCGGRDVRVPQNSTKPSRRAVLSAAPVLLTGLGTVSTSYAASAEAPPARSQQPFALALSTGSETEPFLKNLEQQGNERALEPKVAALFTSCIPKAMDNLGYEGFQQTFIKLRAREWPYYRETYASQLSAIPTLTDFSGGLSNPVYFNFISYITWKSMVLTVKDDVDRGKIANESGRIVVNSILEDQGGLEAISRAAKASPSGRVPWPAVAQSIYTLLTRLQASRYILGYNLIAGDTPTLSNPQASASGRPAVASSIDQEEARTLVPGDVFQVRLLLPADRLGAVSFQQEAGYTDANWNDLFFFQDAYRPPTSVVDKLMLAIGDPLFLVQIPWEPTSLVMDFAV